MAEDQSAYLQPHHLPVAQTRIPATDRHHHRLREVRDRTQLELNALNPKKKESERINAKCTALFHSLPTKLGLFDGIHPFLGCNLYKGKVVRAVV